MSHNALRNTTPVEMRERALRSADSRVAALTNQPARNIRARREAFEKMSDMIRRVQEYACRTGKLGLVIGSGFYVAHNGEHFTVVRGADKVFEKSLMRVVTLFDPLVFMSGHLE